MDALVGQRTAELPLQDRGHAAHHEVDDRLRRVDDAVCVGDFDGEALEELLVDGVEKVLLVRKVADCGGGALDGGVEAVQFAEKLVAAEGMGGERVNDVFDLEGDHVAAGEGRPVEDGAKQPLGQQVLDQHLLDRGLGQVWVDRLAALVEKAGERGRENTVVLPFLLDQFGQPLADVGHPVLELGDGLLPGGVLLRAVGKEGVEGFDELGGVGEVVVEDHAPVLPQNRPFRRLEEDVVARVAGGEFALDFGGQVVVDIFGFPVAVREAEVVDEGAVDDDALAAAGVDGVLGHEGPAGLAAAVLEESLESGAHGGLVGDAEVGELVERGVVGFDGFVGGFEVEHILVGHVKKW